MLGELEIEIMDLFWENHKPTTGRVVFDSIKTRRKIAYTTVMTIMNRLVEKRMLKRIPDGKAYSYKANYSKDKFLSIISKQILKNLTTNFGEIAVAHFATEIVKIPVQRRKALVNLLKRKQGK